MSKREDTAIIQDMKEAIDRIIRDCTLRFLWFFIKNITI